MISESMGSNHSKTQVPQNVAANSDWKQPVTTWAAISLRSSQELSAAFPSVSFPSPPLLGSSFSAPAVKSTVESILGQAHSNLTW